MTRLWVGGLSFLSAGTRCTAGPAATPLTALVLVCSLLSVSCGDGSANDSSTPARSTRDTGAAGYVSYPTSDSLVVASRESNPRREFPSRPAAPATTILFIGTSLTAGYGIDLSQAYPAVVGQMLDSAGHAARIVNAGLSGETSAGALRRIDWVLKTPADVIIVETGANDGLRGLDLAALKRNIENILDRIRALQPNAHIMLAQMEAPPNLGARYTAEFHDLFPAVAKEKRVELMPFLLDGVAGDEALNQDDGIHPNVRGARIVAANVTRALLRRNLP